jgi:hypothetical protein
MNCGSCGSPIPDSVHFCVKCGAPVEQARVAPPRVQYIPPGKPGTPPPTGPDRMLLWAGVALAALVVIAAAIAIPLLLRSGNGDTAAGNATTSSPAASNTTSTSLAATSTTAAPGPVGDSAGAWAEVPVTGGPWSAQEVAVSEEALLIVTQAGAASRLSALMLDSDDVITLSESDALGGVDIDGRLAVWWEGAGWDATTETYAEQYIDSYLLPSGPENLLAEGAAGDRMGMPQVARPWVTWVLSAPWADNPTEYLSERIMYARVGESGAPVGAAGELVPSALALALGDSGWQYGLSSTRVTWEHGVTAEGYDLGTHVMRVDLGGHQSIGQDAWRPSLWNDTLVYWDGGLKMTDLTSGGTRDLDPSGDFATAGPTFAAYYRPGGVGSLLVARGYSAAHEQILDEMEQPPYFCPVISVSASHIAYVFENQVHLFEWQPQ